MFKTINFQDSFLHARNMIQSMLQAYPFFVKHKLWKGFFAHKWIALATVIVSIIFSMIVLGDVSDYLFADNVSVPVNESGLNLELDKEDIAKDKKSAFSSGSKFLLLVILEMVIFFFSIKTIDILRGRETATNFKMFRDAEIRMFKVSIRSYVQALIVQIILSIAFSLVGYGDYDKYVMILVTGYFIGYAFFDNYNEQFELKIKQSDLIVRQHAGAAAVLGAVVSTLLLVPVIGPMITPIFGAIAANLYGYKYKMENTYVPVKVKKNKSKTTLESDQSTFV